MDYFQMTNIAIHIMKTELLLVFDYQFANRIKQFILKCMQYGGLVS